MIVLIAVLLALIPAAAVLYPFFRRSNALRVYEDERSTYSELSRRWEAAVAGLRAAELDRAVGTVTEEDYRWIREQHMNDAALALKAMELEDQQQEELLAGVEREVRRVRTDLLGDGGTADMPGSDGAAREHV